MNSIFNARFIKNIYTFYLYLRLSFYMAEEWKTFGKHTFYESAFFPSNIPIYDEESFG